MDKETEKKLETFKETFFRHDTLDSEKRMLEYLKETLTEQTQEKISIKVRGKDNYGMMDYWLPPLFSNGLIQWVLANIDKEILSYDSLLEKVEIDIKNGLK